MEYTYQQLKNLKTVEMVNEEILNSETLALRKHFSVNEYFDHVKTKYDPKAGLYYWIDLKSGLALCEDDCFVISTVFFSKNGNAIASSYCFSDGSYESSEMEDDVLEVIVLWLEMERNN